MAGKWIAGYDVAGVLVAGNWIAVYGGDFGKYANVVCFGK
jgi:hypothetical protein